MQVSEALGRHGCSDAISLVSGRDEVADLLKVNWWQELFGLKEDLFSWTATLTWSSHVEATSWWSRSRSVPSRFQSSAMVQYEFTEWIISVCCIWITSLQPMASATLTWTSTLISRRYILLSRNSSSCLPMQSIKIVVDAKTDYPAACNAMETLLVHERLLDTDVFYKVQTTHNLVYMFCLVGLQGLESGWCWDLLWSSPQSDSYIWPSRGKLWSLFISVDKLWNTNFNPPFSRQQNLPLNMAAWLAQLRWLEAWKRLSITSTSRSNTTFSAFPSTSRSP